MSASILDTIKGPLDLKKLTLSEMETLAIDVRQRIVDVMATKGGHLASSLGAVEINLALHKVFNSPKDKFIFDVGHQTYTHKIVTGRNEQFDTIRQYKGLCGFTHPEESPHDHFHAGHAGTALSLGLGAATTRDLDEGTEHVIPVIGDATLTCGLTMEALNNIPDHLKRFIVVLNDNAMSISKNVGAITHILSRLLNNPTSNKIYDDIENLLSRIPSYGSSLIKQGQRVKESIKHLVSQASYFEQFHLSYIGPIDGHNMKQLLDTFEALKDTKKPVLVHVLTRKGCGLNVAEQNPITWHGVKPFNPGTCQFIPSSSSKPSFPKIFGEQVFKMAQEDKDIVAVTPAMSKGSCLDDFMEAFPDRCIDVGIAEGHSVSFAGGLAYQKKKKVICSVYGSFLQRALDNVFLDVCLQELPVVLAVDRAGLSGPDGATHHGIYDISFLKAMPNMIIAQPRNGHVLRELLASAFSWNSPTAIRYPNMVTDDAETELKPRLVGKAEVLATGKEILLIGLGHMNQVALEVREALKEHGYQATVMDPVFVKPLDSDLLHQLLLTHDKIVTIEEHSVMGGLGASLNHFLMSRGLNKAQVLNLGIGEEFISHGDYASLMDEVGLTTEKITKRIVEDFNLQAIENKSKTARVD